MLNKDCDRTVAKAALVDPFPDVFGDFVRPLAIRADFKLLLVDAHRISGTKISSRTKIVAYYRLDLMESYRNLLYIGVLRKELIATNLIIR
jgi:hypothetical protein